MNQVKDESRCPSQNRHVQGGDPQEEMQGASGARVRETEAGEASRDLQAKVGI